MVCLTWYLKLFHKVFKLASLKSRCVHLRYSDVTPSHFHGVTTLSCSKLVVESLVVYNSIVSISADALLDVVLPGYKNKGS